MDLEFAKALYFRELDRRTDLDAAPTFRVAVLAVLGGIVSFYIDRYGRTSAFLEALFVVAIAGAIMFSSLSVAWMVRSYVGWVWSILPTATDLKAYYDSLEVYDSQYGIDAGTPQSVFEEHLLTLLVTAATRNNRNNNARSDIMAGATLFVVIATVFTLVAGIPVIYHALQQVVLRNF